MDALRRLSDRGLGAARGWDRFWFTAADPATLSLIRLFAGAMLLYTHLVWSLDLQAFFGAEGWLSRDLMSRLHNGDPVLQQLGVPTYSIFWWIESSWLLWAVHLTALLIFAMLMLGIGTRVVSVLAFLLAASYANRVTPGAYFGLDKINCMLALYLIIGPSGARYSLDHWLARRRGTESVEASVSANVAIRLIQIHMCVIYLFSGLDKYMGMVWRDGTAVWWSAANLEYQSLDLTWLAAWPTLVAAMTYLTVFWEISYAALVWPRATRPWVLSVALLIHGGIAIALGMITFGLVMLIGNLAFVPPEQVRAALRWRIARGEETAAADRLQERDHGSAV